LSEPKALRLIARDADDLKVVSACLQDALVPVSDIAWLREEGQLALAVNRFMWERAPEHLGPGQFYHRTHALIRIDGVSAVRSRGYDRRQRADILSLLSLQPVDAGVEMLFANGAAIHVTLDPLVLTLADMASPWPTRWRPDHADADPIA